MDRKIAMLVHADSGVGKSRLLDTAPGPRLILDVEGGTDWTPSPKVYWDPAGPLPVEGITTDTSIVVNILDFNTMKQVYNWLSVGNHYFQSVCIDSLTEAQKRCKDGIAGADTFSERNWGQLLSQMELLVRNYRDLRKHPTCPVNVFISAITVDKDNTRKADVQGALGRSLPGLVDVVAYMHTAPGESGMERRLLIQPAPGFQAKDRTDILSARFGGSILTSVERQDICNLVCVTDVLNGRI